MSTTTTSPNSTNDPPKPTLLTLLSIPPIFHNLTTHLSTPSLLSLLSTHPSLSTPSTKHTIFNINIHLHYFLHHPRKFRSLMARHQALISGSDALQFLAGETYEEADLDVYLEGEDGLLAFSEYLMSSEEGYNFIPCEWQEAAVADAIKGRLRLLDRLARAGFPAVTKHTSSHDQGSADAGMGTESNALLYESRTIEGVYLFVRGKKRVQLIASKGPPVYSILNDYYSTHLMNFYTWRRAYALFPRRTFVKREGVLTQPVTQRLDGRLGKYRGRGWGFTAQVFDDSQKKEGKEEVRGKRRVGDRFTWKLDLDTEGVDVDYLDRDLVEHEEMLEMTTFGTEMTDRFVDWYGNRSYGGEYLRICCRPVRMACLRGVLVVDSLNPGWRAFVVNVLEKYSRRWDGCREENTRGGKGREVEMRYLDGEVRVWWDIFNDIVK